MATDWAEWLAKTAPSPLNRRPGRQKVAILGAASRGQERPPLDDDSWDVWGCNSLWSLAEDRHHRFRADAWFELHPFHAQTPMELAAMRACPVPLYVLATSPYAQSDTAHWLVYPLDDVRARFGPREYYTCTFAYQIALALLLGYTEIGLWGVELWGGSTRERRVELPCVAYWLGMAKGRGVTVTLPESSQLIAHPHLYGYDYDEDVAQSKEDDAELIVSYCRAHRAAFRKYAAETDAETLQLNALDALEPSS